MPYAKSADLPGHSRTGTGPRVCALFTHFILTSPHSPSTLDADDFYNSPIFDPNTKSGFGGWGDPTNDFQITTGAFASDFVRAYPVPHGVRRNFTLLPGAGGFGDGSPIYTNPLPTWIAPPYVEAMVDGFPGDFLGFQALFEGGNGPHGAVHQMLGG